MVKCRKLIRLLFTIIVANPMLREESHCSFFLEKLCTFYSLILIEIHYSCNKAFRSKKSSDLVIFTVLNSSSDQLF